MWRGRTTLRGRATLRFRGKATLFSRGKATLRFRGRATPRGGRTHVNLLARARNPGHGVSGRRWDSVVAKPRTPELSVYTGLTRPGNKNCRDSPSATKIYRFWFFQRLIFKERSGLVSIRRRCPAIRTIVPTRIPAREIDSTVARRGSVQAVRAEFKTRFRGFRTQHRTGRRRTVQREKYP